MRHPTVTIYTLFCVSLLFGGWPGAAAGQQQSGDEPIPMVSTGHSQGVEQVVFSPDGRWLASSGGDRTVKLWDAGSGRMLRTLSGHTDEIRRLGISPDGKWVVTNSEDNTIRIWDARTGAVAHTLRPPDEMTTWDFTIGANDLLITDDLLALHLWNIVSGEMVGTLSIPNTPSDFQLPSRVALSPDGQLIAVGYSKGTRSPVSQTAILDATTGEQLKVLKGHKGDVWVLAFSPDGRLLATGGNDKTIKVWDIATGSLLHTTPPQSETVASVSFSPDGKRLASVMVVEKAIRIWDVATGSLLRTIETPSYWSSVAYSPDGRLLATGGSPDIDLWNAETGDLVRSMEGAGEQWRSVYILPAPGENWFTQTGKLLHRWDAATGQVTKTYPSLWGRLAASGPDAQGRWLHVEPDKQTLKVWDANAEKDVATLTMPEGQYLEGLSPDGAMLLIGKGHELRAWDTTTGKVLWKVTRPLEYEFSPSFSRDGHWLAATAHDYKRKEQHLIRIWDATSGRSVKTFRGDEDLPNDIAYSPDGHRLIGWETVLTSFDSASGQKLWAASKEDYDVGRVAVSPDSRVVVAADGFSPLLSVWDVSTGELIRRLDGNPGNADSLHLGQNGKRVVAGNSNGTSAIWDLASGALLASTAESQSGEWVTITPEGFFAASEKGAELLHVVKGFGTIGIAQVYQALYRPDLVQQKLAGDPDGKVKEAAAKLDLDKVLQSGAAPKVSIVNPADKSSANGDDVAVEAQVSDQGGGVGKVEWRVNGTTLGVEERGLSRVETPSGGPAITIKKTLSLEPGENHIEVVAYNGQNLIASEPARITVSWDGESGATPPKLYVLTVGVNDYWDSRLKLNYAVPDAQALADAFGKAGGNLYGGVEVKSVRDAEVTSANLDQVFANLAKEVHARDTFVFFIAGHGKTVDGRYYYLPQDFRYEGEESIVKSGIDQEKLQAWFAGIPARRSVLLFDTCESGTLTGDRVAQRGLERVAALERMTRAMGRTVLSASTDDAPALEGYRGHGVFTYAVLDGLGASDANGNGTIEVTELASFVDQKVPELSYEAFKQRQVPQMKIVGSNFTLSSKVQVAAAGGAPVDAVPSKPSHVAIVPADVFAAAGGTGAAVATLQPGSAVAVVKTEQGWVLIAKDGKSLGYVAAGSLAPIQ